MRRAKSYSYTGETVNFKQLTGKHAMWLAEDRLGSHDMEFLTPALALLTADAAKTRKDALDTLSAYFINAGRGYQNQHDSFDDKVFHRLFEGIFGCALIEKEQYFDSKRAPGSRANAGIRLERCGDVLRLAVRHGATRIKRKTAKAVLDHITQILPGPDDSYITPLLQNYLKALVTMLEHSSTAEAIAASTSDTWEAGVDFCVEGLSRFHDSGGRDGSSLGRASPASGVPTRSGFFAASQGSNQLASGVALDFLMCLHALVVAPNAPVARKADRVSEVLLNILRMRSLTIGELQKVSFSAFNALFQRTQTDDVSLSKKLARNLIPLLSHWWQPRALSRDAMLNSIRDEMLKTIYGTHLYVESLLRESADESFFQEVEDLLDALWSEYSRRDERARIQLDDVTFTTMRLPEHHPSTTVFSLRSYNQAGEQNWALLENLAILETAYSRYSQRERSQQQPDNDQPRKRRRMAGSSNRIHQKLQSLDPAVRLSALQLIPFLMKQRQPSLEDITIIVAELTKSVTAKQGTVASWAMLACASFTGYETSRHASLSLSWKLLWQLGVRALSLPAASRAACVLLHSILKANILPRHELADDVNQIVTTADISGPAVLVDSSLVLMLSLLRLRNNMFPNASQATSNHIIRWVFVRWNPAELIYASLHAIHAAPYDLANLLRACYGASALTMEIPLRLFEGSIGQFWKGQAEFQPIVQYLLLLDQDDEPNLTMTRSAEEQASEAQEVFDPTGSHAARRLVLELLHPKVEELQQLAESWQKRGTEVAAPVSTERLQSMVLACLAAVLLLPELVNLNTSMSRDLETAIFGIVDVTFKVILAAPSSENFFELVLTSSAPYIPPLTHAELAHLVLDQPYLLKFFGKLSDALHERSRRESSLRTADSLDIDDEFESQTSQNSTAAKHKSLPRRDILLCYTPESFYLETSLRVNFLDALRLDDGEIGRVPKSIVDQLAELPKEQFLLCWKFMQELFTSDAITSVESAMNVLGIAGRICSSDEFMCCEVALCNFLDIADSFISMWTDEELLDIAEMAGDFYYHLVKTGLPNNLLSPAAQTRFSSLLLHLLEVKSSYASSLELPSSRSTLMTILQEGSMEAKYTIGRNLSKIFGLYVLKTHDTIFVDVLESLPSDPEDTEGIAFRLFVLAELACRWPTLLRRCIYHIFETPGKISQSGKYAASCLKRIARTLNLSGPQVLFRLFAPQLLYTWLYTDSIQVIPFEIFGYPSLHDLLKEAQTEAAAIMIMRGQEKEALDLAQSLGLTTEKLVQQSFTKIISYSIAHDISVPGGADYVTGESRLRKILGKEGFLSNIHLNFADIIATFFDIFDQEGPIEKAFQRDDRFASAAKVMDDIKKLGHQPAALPPNQQPMFKAKYLPREILHLCSRTPYEPETLWTPALVVFVARKLLNTIHPALGPLHACSILRKIRVLICMAGDHATTAYPLEMLLQSLRTFVVDPECADDALGITQYLVLKGDAHLRQTPSFLAGYALSSLADLRVFLESSQSSTTQESQFKATMTKAQLFHSWFSEYLAGYESPAFQDGAQKAAFKTITQSAAHIRASGNAEKGTHESNLLLEILQDWAREKQLLNEPARDVALSMLCGVFKVPPSSRLDVIETDEDALSHGAVVWKSCASPKLSGEYLAWAGRVLGRSFAASGEVPDQLLRESQLKEYRRLALEIGGSEEGLLNLIEALTVSGDFFTAGLAEAALRTVVSDAVGDDDQDLLGACQQSLSEPLLVSSNWDPYRTPQSDQFKVDTPAAAEVFSPKHLESPSWSQDLATLLAHSVPEIVTLRVLPPILSKVKGFAERAFPFVVHLVLTYQLDKQQGVKRQLSEALRQWLNASSDAAKENLKLLINTILYLRTQPLPGEASIADRGHWLDLNFSSAAAAATRCGMFKVAVLFVELANSESSRTSRRSSVIREIEDSSEILLDIFENIDDPDAYYGLNQDASLSTVLSRLEYENDGGKSLAFRGAQYDSHLRSRDAGSRQDGQALIKALSSLGLAGLANSLLQTQQSLDGSSDSLDGTFTTARRLEMWNLPTPSTSDNWAVTVYRGYQSMHQAPDVDAVRAVIHDGLRSTVKHLTSRSLNTSTLRHQLGALAVLAELDDVLNVADQGELQHALKNFERRSKWMMSGRYPDVGQILSCRETTLSMWSQHHKLRATGLTPADARLVQIRGILLSSDIFRFHRANQETLNLSTTLTDLIPSCESLGLSVDAAIRIEAANSLWDHGEMISSIRMLQNIDKESLKKQTVPVSRSDLLSKIGYQVSVARLESPDSIQKKYLEPALKELKGKLEGKEAGQVFHQFAMFCDEQLQNPDSLEDLARLQSLKKGKDEEVAQLKAMIANSKDSQHRNRYSSHLAKARQWQELDQQELRRVEQTRSEFLRLSLENYLLSLAASDEHNNDALRFMALWLEQSEENVTNEAVKKYIGKVPTRKFAPLMNQLSSRLQDQSVLFQKLLIDLVYRICVDHPYHGMYHIWSGARTRVNKDDEVAVSRQKATDRVAKALTKSETVSRIWPAIDQTSRAYHALAMDRDPNRYKAGQKMAIKNSSVGQNFLSILAKYPIPPPTMQITLSASQDYSDVPMIHKFEPEMSIASGVSAPKIITAIGTNGQKFKQLVKGGNDDLRQDAIMEQVFAAVSELLKLHRTTRQRNLHVRTYKVLPLTSSSGLIEFVSNTTPLHEYLMPAHERYHPKDLKGSQCRKEISNAQTKSIETRIAVYRKVTERFHPVMRYFFMEHFVDPDEWFMRRTAYTRTTAAISVLGHVLGLGDRHGHNILLDTKTGEVVHIDLGVAFEMGRVLPVPELVPFRLTRDIVDGMGVTKTEGVFRRCCEFTLDALREEAGSIQTILDSLRHDTLYQWSISPGDAEEGEGGEEEVGGAGGGVGKEKKKGSVNEPSEADRAIEVVKKKLSKTLSVMATVNDLINQATSVSNLAVLYSA
ncbi:Serine/threonine-protein kinase tel1 [Collariella sp. IMI 366227]|nr:Serine/threonine-protein kinase tel1 [Collariella sp. IMI 366227]